MEGYLGEFELKDKGEFSDLSKSDWALYFITLYGGFEGNHHKNWLLDQVSKILHGADVKVSVAKWKCGFEEYRFRIGEPTESYKKWVKDIEDSGFEYDYGIPP